MSKHFPFGEVPFNGDLKAIERFYETLGIKIVNGALLFENFQVFFGGEDVGIFVPQVVFEVDKQLSEVEARLLECGGSILETGFDGSGPFAIVLDPAGSRLRVGMSRRALRDAAKGGPS